ncbi:MAG: hypothetical protein QXW02_04510, partial [Nitrososphaerota archaeon]
VPKAFAEITPLDVEFKPLLMKERALARQLMRLRQMLELGIDFEDEIENHEDAVNGGSRRDRRECCGEDPGIRGHRRRARIK